MNEKLYKICTRLKNSFTYDRYSKHAINAARDVVSPDKRKRKEKYTNEQKRLWDAGKEITETIPEGFNFKDIVNCSRQSFKAKGNLEKLSEELIHKAIEGDVIGTAQILRKGDIHPDVTDATGFSAMLAAAVSIHYSRNQISKI